MADFTDPAQQRKVTEALTEFMEPMGSKGFIVIGISPGNQGAVLPLGWTPDRETLVRVLQAVASATWENELRINIT